MDSLYGKGKDVHVLPEHPAIMARWRSEGIAPHILDLDPSWR
jgi:hypothetical protein